MSKPPSIHAIGGSWRVANEAGPSSGRLKKATPTCCRIAVAVQRKRLPDRRRTPEQVVFRMEKLVDEVRRLRSVTPGRRHSSNGFLCLSGVGIVTVVLLDEFLRISK